MLLTPEIITIYMLDIIFLVFAFFAFVISVSIVKNWDISSTTKLQYSLEKRAILAATIIKYIFVLKLPLFVFFVFTADKMSDVMTGAMCAAGVVNSVSFGLWLFVFKILNLYIFGFWIALHNKDMRDEKLPFTKLKFSVFIVAFVLLVMEILYEVSFFNSLNVDKIVSCCGTLFSASSSSAFASIFMLPNSITVSAFYTVFASLLLSYFYRNVALFLVMNALYFIISLLSLVLFFGTYIYELPTHHCPFCFLQKDYYYVGYLIYITLFVGTFSGISGSILTMLSPSHNQSFYKTSIAFNSFYLLIVSAYPVVYYIKNGVWL